MAESPVGTMVVGEHVSLSDERTSAHCPSISHESLTELVAERGIEIMTVHSTESDLRSQ
jgi:hypothetical protein